MGRACLDEEENMLCLKTYEKAGEKMADRNYTYILECRDGTYYTGWTTDIDRRLAAHNSGHGAKYTKSRRPVKLVYYEMFGTKEEAMSRECSIKRMPRREKTALIKSEKRETP